MKIRKAILGCVMLLASCSALYADIPFYLVEWGVMGGTSYYVGDLHEYIFMRPQYAAGMQVSYHFNRRWSITAKSQFCEIGFIKSSGLPNNRLINTDVTAEYNFFRFDMRQYDPRIKPVTPYIAIGLGWSLFGKKFADNSMYVPFILGMKWKMAPHWTMNIAWQHQIHFGFDSDKIENSANYDNTYKLNKSNIIRYDLVSTLTLGISFAFAQKPKKCMICKDEKPKKIKWEQRVPRD